MRRDKFWSGWLAPSRPRPAPASGAGRHRLSDAAGEGQAERLTAGPESEPRRLLRERLRATTPIEQGPRVQKNLSLTRHDADRMAALARRDRRSQARLITAALDCYEAAYGRLDDGMEG